MSAATTVEQDVAHAEAAVTEGVNKGPPTVTVTGPPPGMTLDKMVEKYVVLRDQLAAVKKVQVEANKPFVAAMDRLEGWMLAALQAGGVTSMKAEHGTFFQTTRTSATVTEWSKTLEYIQEKEAWELLEARVNKTAVEAILTETNQPIPGVKVTRETVLNVRRA